MTDPGVNPIRNHRSSRSSKPGSADMVAAMQGYSAPQALPLIPDLSSSRSTCRSHWPAWWSGGCGCTG